MDPSCPTISSRTSLTGVYFWISRPGETCSPSEAHVRSPFGGQQREMGAVAGKAVFTRGPSARSLVPGPPLTSEPVRGVPLHRARGQLSAAAKASVQEGLCPTWPSAFSDRLGEPAYLVTLIFRTLRYPLFTRHSAQLVTFGGVFVPEL